MTREEAEQFIKPTKGHTLLIGSERGCSSPFDFPWRVVKSEMFDVGTMVLINSSDHCFHKWLDGGHAAVVMQDEKIMAVWAGPREESK